MSPQEHEALKARAAAAAQDVLLDWAAKQLRIAYALMPASGRQTMLTATRTALEKQSAALKQKTYPVQHPALSDLYSAVYQEAFEDLSQNLLKTLEQDLTPDELAELQPPR